MYTEWTLHQRHGEPRSRGMVLRVWASDIGPRCGATDRAVTPHREVAHRTSYRIDHVMGNHRGPGVRCYRVYYPIECLYARESTQFGGSFLALRQHPGAPFGAKSFRSRQYGTDGRSTVGKSLWSSQYSTDGRSAVGWRFGSFGFGSRPGWLWIAFQAGVLRGRAGRYKMIWDYVGYGSS